MFYKKKLKVPKMCTKKNEKDSEIAPVMYNDLPPLLGITLQETIGNQEVQQMFRTSEILAKLYVSNPGDVYE
ncbi:MAG: hypothetical protein JXJ04_25680 [Spirochaetales bacterium]|nr:hypothetical protein [Spirochaetales bacterium]